MFNPYQYAFNYNVKINYSERVVLAAKNVDVNNEINFQIQNKIAGELMTYKSIDSVTNQNDVVNTEFQNSLELPVLPFNY